MMMNNDDGGSGGTDGATVTDFNGQGKGTDIL